MHYLIEYKTFQSKHEMNDAVAEHLSEHRYELSETDRTVLNTIACYSVKYAGASHLKAATLAKLVDKSDKTIRRSINRLCELRIIRKVVMMRPVSGGNGANIIQILPFDELRFTRNELRASDHPKPSNREKAVKPAVASDKTATSENKPFISFKQNTVINNTYRAFKQSVEYFINDAKLTNKLYGIYLAHTSFLRNCHESSELLNCGIDAILTTFKATKRKAIRNIVGYYHGVLDRVLDRLMYAVLPSIAED